MMRATNFFTDYKADLFKRQYRNELDEYSVSAQTTEEDEATEANPVSSEQE